MTLTLRPARGLRAFCISLLLCAMWPPQSSAALSEDAPAKFDVCRPYTQMIETAVARRFPADFQYPLAWTAQLYQESLCNPEAASHVGAGGIAQFMPRTAQEMARRLGFDFDRFDAAQAIDAGAYYQARMTAPFRRRGRTPEQANELGSAAYNSGLGNVLRAQKKCGGARLWDDISPCQSQVTGHHAAETITYVKRIKRWTNEMGDPTPWEVPAGWRAEVTQVRRATLAASVDVRRYFTGRSWCSYFAYGGGWITAGHCHDEIAEGDVSPPFVEGLTAEVRPAVIDAAAYGVTWPDTPPPRIKQGMSVETIGYPAGSDALAYRKGVAYIKRRDGGEDYEHGGWIVSLPAGLLPSYEREPVVGGQSGSPGLDKAGNPICIVVNQNGLTDLTKDGILDNSFDCVSLRDVWEVLQ